MLSEFFFKGKGEGGVNIDKEDDIPHQLADFKYSDNHTLDIIVYPVFSYPWRLVLMMMVTKYPLKIQ